MKWVPRWIDIDHFEDGLFIIITEELCSFGGVDAQTAGGEVKR